MVSRAIRQVSDTLWIEGIASPRAKTPAFTASITVFATICGLFMSDFFRFSDSVFRNFACESIICTKLNKIGILRSIKNAA